MKFKIVSEYLVDSIRSISVAVDTMFFDEDSGQTFKLSRNRQAFVPGSFNDLAAFLQEAEIDQTELMGVANVIWTGAIIDSWIQSQSVNEL